MLKISSHIHEASTQYDSAFFPQINAALKDTLMGKNIVWENSVQNNHTIIIKITICPSGRWWAFLSLPHGNAPPPRMHTKQINWLTIWLKVKCDHRSKFFNLSNWKEEAQLEEHRSGIAEVMGSNPVEALIFFRLLLSNCLNWKIYCDDHTSLSSTTAVQIWIISYIFHMISLHGKIWTR